jgi:hypothetical protein
MEEDQRSIELGYMRDWTTRALWMHRYLLGVSLRASGMGWGGTAFPDYTYRRLVSVNTVLTERGEV